MKQFFKIQHTQGERTISQDDFPLVIGGSAEAGIPIDDSRIQGEVAYISLREGHLFIHPAKTAVPLQHNHTVLKGSARLQHGDRLQVGSTVILYGEDEKGVTFKVCEADEPCEAPSPLSPKDTPGEQMIEPLPFRPGQVRSPSRTTSRVKWILGGSLALLLIFLFYTVWFVFTSRQVVIHLTPKPDRVAIKGSLLEPRFGDYYLLRPGHYVLKGYKKGYHRLEHPFEVSRAKSQKLDLVMERLPGRLTLTTHQEDAPSVVIEGAKVFLDGEEIGVTPLEAVEVKAGQRQLIVRAQKYSAFTTQLDIEGMGRLQSFDFALAPGWSSVEIRSVPQGARVYLDQVQKGETPLTLELAEGSYGLKITAESFKPWQTELEVGANQPLVLDTIQLKPADGILVLRTTPPGANVIVGGNYAGQTPVEIPLEPDTSHQVTIAKAGYENIERTITVTTARSKEVSLRLAPRKGIINLAVTPVDAEIFIDGKSQGKVPRSLNLIAVTHSVKIVKQGYEPHQTKITPRPGFPQEIKVSLKKKRAAPTTPSGVIKASNGYSLKLITPAPFTMGSSRREQGRRSNETLRKIVLTRPFYMGMREITNGEFRRFLSGHNSGSLKGYSLNRDELPVVQVSWQQAALFCNWLSKKDNLPPVYVKKNGTLVAKEPLPTGYRLPTEAEWEYCARFSSGGVSLRYPWGGSFPPHNKTLNIADVSAKDVVTAYLDNYRDGYAVTASPGSFKPNPLGLFDLGGNVAEWCHDYYSIYSFSPSTVYRDSTGPAEGTHHLVRGSSWKHASISVMRNAYRDYSSATRTDLGFRICSYTHSSSKKK